MFPLRDSYASAARAALELRLADVHPNHLPAVLADPEVRDLIEQANQLPPQPPAAFSENGRIELTGTHVRLQLVRT